MIIITPCLQCESLILISIQPIIYKVEYVRSRILKFLVVSSKEVVLFVLGFCSMYFSLDPKFIIFAFVSSL